MNKPIKYVEQAVTIAANGAWHVFNTFNSINRNASFTPKWSEKPLLKSWEKQKPTLGWPRTTDSLCPICVPAIRNKIVNGEVPVEILRNEKVGEIKAQIIERDGKILMVKDCPEHGHFEDVMAIDPAFLQHIEKVFPGRDIRAHNDKDLHNHGSSTVTHGRGSVLTIDLTNRCNMMCDPCFMDANQVGFVHELSWEDIKTMLDNAISIKPRRQMSVQFSGGEPRFRLTSSTRCVTPARSVTTACRRPRMVSNSPSAPSFASKRPKQVCVTRICSSMAWATPPTRIAPSATCST